MNLIFNIREVIKHKDYKGDVTYQLLNDVEISFESLGESLTLKKGEKYVQNI